MPVFATLSPSSAVEGKNVLILLGFTGILMTKQPKSRTTQAPTWHVRHILLPLRYGLHAENFLHASACGWNVSGVHTRTSKVSCGYQALEV